MYLEAYATDICENTFASLYAWRHAKPISALEAHNSLIILVEEPQGFQLYGPPLGPITTTEAADIVLQCLGKPIISVERMTEAQARELEEQRWHVIEDRDNFDYVYCRQALAGLAGRRYHRKRNLVCQCLRTHRCSYEPISASNHAEILEVLHAWRQRRGPCIDEELNCESSAIADMLEHYEELEVIGGAVRVNGRIEAFSMAAKLAPTTAVVHFEKANVAIKGLYQLLNKWFAEYALAEFTLVNREQDNGLPGLMRAKQSYYPLRYVRKFRATFDPSLKTSPPAQKLDLAKNRCDSPPL
jgi:hypothetical protein